MPLNTRWTVLPLSHTGGALVARLQRWHHGETRLRKAMLNESENEEGKLPPSGLMARNAPPTTDVA